MNRLASLALAAFAVCCLLALIADAGTGPLAKGTAYLITRQQPDGGFAEAGQGSDPSLTAWAVLGLKAAGQNPSQLTISRNSPAAYLAGRPTLSATDLELQILALHALGNDVSQQANQLAQLQQPNGRIGPLVNSTIWGLIALKTAGTPIPPSSIHYLISQQRRNGGWSWAPNGAPDSNDTAAAIEALRATGLRSSTLSLRRGLKYLRNLQNRDGGFALSPGQRSDAQSTAWAIQAFAAAGVPPSRGSLRYLLRLQRPDGSFRYSTQYATSPAFVTAQVLPALAHQPFPLH